MERSYFFRWNRNSPNMGRCVGAIFVALLVLLSPNPTLAKDAPANKRAKVEPLRTPQQFTISSREHLVWALAFKKTLERAQKPIDFLHRWTWNTGDIAKHQCIDDGRDKWQALVARSDKNYRTMLRAVVQKAPQKRRAAGNDLARDHMYAIFLDQELQKCGLKPLLRMSLGFQPSPLYHRLRKRWTSR